MREPYDRQRVHLEGWKEGLRRHRHKGADPAITRSTRPSRPPDLLFLSTILPPPTIPRPIPTMSNQSRQDLIQNAILFLQDPKTQSSPLTSKIEFLQAKGLNESEIQDALARSASSSTSSSSVPFYTRTIGESNGGGGYGGGLRYEMAPVPPKRDWRDLFVCPLPSCLYGWSADGRSWQ